MKKILFLLVLVAAYASATDNYNILDRLTPTITGGTIDGAVIGGTTPAAGAFTSVTASGNVKGANLLPGQTLVTADGGTTVLTSASARIQQLTGATTETYQLPDATTLTAGWTFEFNNNSTGTMTINDASAAVVTTLNAGAYARISLTSGATAAGVWDKHFLAPANARFSSNALSVNGAIRIGTAQTLTVTSGALAMTAITASASAPGAAGAKLEVVCGTNAGTAKLIMYAGTSATAVTVVDNVGGGVTGC